MLSDLNLANLSHSNAISIGRVIFLTEEHASESDRQKNANYLHENYELARGDIILVEDSQAKASSLLNLAQLGSFSSAPCQIEGWDDPESCMKATLIEKNFNFVLSSVERLAGDIFPKGGEMDVIRLKTFATNFEIPFSEETGIVIDNQLFNEPQRRAQKQLFLNATCNFIITALGRLTYQHFAARQNALRQKIEESLLKTSTGHIFVMAGKKHVDFSDQKIRHLVHPLLFKLKAFSQTSKSEA